MIYKCYNQLIDFDISQFKNLLIQHHFYDEFVQKNFNTNSKRTFIRNFPLYIIVYLINNIQLGMDSLFSQMLQVRPYGSIKIS